MSLFLSTKGDRSWILDLPAVGVCAVFLARAASHAVAPPEVVAPPPSGGPVAAAMALEAREVAIARNIFCSACADQAPAAPARGRCDLPLDLVAIVDAPGVAGWSRALVREAGDRSLRAVAVGSTVHGARVDAIDGARVLLRGGACDDVLSLLDDRSPRPSTPPAPRAAPASDRWSAGLRATGEHSYELPRATLEHLLADVDLLARSARLVPEVRDGAPAGWRLHRVAPDGPFARIGLRDGDLVVAVNGLDLASAPQALDAFVKLRSASHVSLAIERRGRRLTKEYVIR